MKDVFCANCQEVKPHKATLSPMGDVDLTCECGRFIRVPSNFDEAALNDHLAKHEESNKGQIAVDKVLSGMGIDPVEEVQEETKAE